MTGQGVGSQGAVCWVPALDPDPASPSHGFGGSEAAVRLTAPRGTRVGPAFVYRPRHWARAARCAPPGPGRCCAPPPSLEKLVRAVRRRPLPRPPGQMLQGKDTQAAPSRPVFLHPEAPCPGPGPSQIGGCRGEDEPSSSLFQ